MLLLGTEPRSPRKGDPDYARNPRLAPVAGAATGRRGKRHHGPAMTRVGILTGGGDVPGLNSVIKSVVYRATELGWEALGIRRGWQGLTHQPSGGEPDPDYVR